VETVFPAPAGSLPRVFVSSVIEGFQLYREAARTAIQEAGGEPVLVNEDFPSRSSSSRNACLDAVDSSDIFVLLVGARGGWVTPSGRLVVEEELEQARWQKLPILVFLQNGKRDEQAERLAQKVSDYVEGYYRILFEDPAALRREMVRALIPLLEQRQKPIMNPDQLNEAVIRPVQIAQQSTLRFVLAPERQEEVIEAPRLLSDDLAHQLLEIGHRKQISLFQYRNSKKIGSEGDCLLIEQAAGSDWRKGIEGVRVSLSEFGVFVIDANVTGRRPRGNATDLGSVMVIAIEDLEAVLRTNFQFIAAVYDEIDPYKRQQRFLWNVALHNIGFRTLTRNPQPQGSYTMHTGGNAPAVAFREPRLATREDLTQPVREVERAVFFWTRR
jgi:hypothetical protein